LLLVFDDRRDPAFALAEQVAREARAVGNPRRVEVLVAGTPPPGRTGKLHAMMHGFARAGGELIAFSDSDTRLDRDVLRVLVETLLETPGAGSAFAPVVAGSPPRTA